MPAALGIDLVDDGFVRQHVPRVRKRRACLCNATKMVDTTKSMSRLRFNGPFPAAPGDLAFLICVNVPGGGDI